MRSAAATKYFDGTKPLHYLNNFGYLNDPCYNGSLLGDGMKNLNDGKLSFGGQYRARFHSEHNHRGVGLTGVSDDFVLHRTRLYADARMSDTLRFFGEVLDANSNLENNTPRGIEENRWDMQNLFFDATLFDHDGGKLVARGGRQEIALGAQRYVSPLDWANTRRTFDGGRLMYSNEYVNMDGFLLMPTIRDVDAFDKSNRNVQLYGLYNTFKKARHGTLDTYWIAFDNDAAGFAFDTVGARYNGKVQKLLFDMEGSFQFGRNADGSDHEAGATTIGLGRKLDQMALSPVTWLYFDWASGGDDLGAGNGHHHYQPLAHKYNGFMDLFGRRNLMDLNWLTTVQLTDRVKLLTWMHGFWLANTNDSPYNVNMSAFNGGITPGDSFLGTEMDVVLSVNLTPRSNFLVGYSQFWSGDYYDTPGLPTNDNANFAYVQYTLNF
ncbi:MAG: alginate export family protein [Planctomycetota bacterium]